MNQTSQKGVGALAAFLGAVVLLLGIAGSYTFYRAAWIPYQQAAAANAALNRIGAADASMKRGAIDSLTVGPYSSVVDLDFLSDMPDIRELNLEFAVIEDDDLRGLSNAPLLQELKLGHAFHDTGLDLVEYFQGEWREMDLRTSEGMAQLQEDISSKLVILRNASITSEGMKHVGEQIQLERLSLRNTAVADDGLEHLAFLPKLKELDLRLTQVTDTGVKTLRQFPALEKLDLGNNRHLTGDCLSDVATIPFLKELRPPHFLSDAQLAALHECKMLERLDLQDSKYSEQALQELRTALPSCEILTASDEGK